MDLSVKVGKLTLKNPVISAAGPNTKNLSIVKKGVDAGCGAIVIRSLHLNKLNEGPRYARDGWDVYYNEGANNFRKDFYSLQSMASPVEHYTIGIDPGRGGGGPVPTLEEWAEEVKKMVDYAHKQDCKIIASIGWCGDRMAGDEVWMAEAKAMSAVGVDAIELHTSPSPATQGARYIQLDPERYLHMPIRVGKTTGLPVFAKIGLDCCDVITASKLAQKWGIDGVILAARWSSLSIDIDHPETLYTRTPGYGGNWVVPILAAYIYRLQIQDINMGYLNQSKGNVNIDGPLNVPIIPSGGVQNADDIIRYLLCGATAIQSCAQILLEGYDVVPRWIKGLTNWMNKHGYSNIDDFRGMAHKAQNVKRIPQYISQICPGKCTGCSACIKACTNFAIELDKDKKAVIDTTRCEGCRNCFYICPSNAVKLTV